MIARHCAGDEFVKTSIIFFSVSPERPPNIVLPFLTASNNSAACARARGKSGTGFSSRPANNNFKINFSCSPLNSDLKRSI